MVMSEGSHSRAGGLKARLQASQAALRELDVLRRRHEALVQDAKDAVIRGKTDKRPKSPASLRSEPQQTHQTEYWGSLRPQSDPTESRGSPRREPQQTNPSSRQNSTCMEQPGSARSACISRLHGDSISPTASRRVHRNARVVNGEMHSATSKSVCCTTDTESPNRSIATIARQFVDDTVDKDEAPPLPPRASTRSRQADHIRAYTDNTSCRCPRVPPPGGLAIDQINCNCLTKKSGSSTSDYRDPRQFSSTTYCYPSPMHAVLLQYHWTRQKDCTKESTGVSTLPVDHRGSSTDVKDLPFIFLSEQTRPENNSLQNLLRTTSYSELAENYDDFDDTPSKMSSSDSVKSSSLSQSSEEGYYSNSDSHTTSSSSADGVKRCSGESDVSFSSSGSDTCSTLSDILTDMPLFTTSSPLKSTRISGVDDGWIDYLDQLSTMQDTIV